MKQTLLLFLASLCLTLGNAQESKAKKITAYAITSQQKGQSSWTEVKLVDIVTGEEVQSVYQSTARPEILNARTGKAIARDVNATNAAQKASTPASNGVEERVVYTTRQKDANGNPSVVIVRTQRASFASPVDASRPFATNSAACAYDKKHERLYYTPMNIAQLRYIDLKSNKIYFFEDEKFGTVKGAGDVQNQITRMTFASDGNGYALSNDARHLIQFTTGKKPTITDLGEIADDAANGTNSIRNSGGFGGDMIADAQKNLYLVTANRNVFRISLENRTATYLGAIKGLPRGFSTNGAFVEEGSKVIVCSSTSTQGYYRFDLGTLEVEKVSTQASVFNASDLASGNLAFEKKKKDRKERKQRELLPLVEEQPLVKDVVIEEKSKQTLEPEAQRNNISVFPNPVVNGTFRLSFAGQPSGKYAVQVLDISGKLITDMVVSVNNKMQVEEFRLPSNLAKGNYVVKVTNAANNFSFTEKLVVQ